MKINRKAYNYGIAWLKHIFHITPQKPKILSYLVTNLCNSHCITCSVWKDTKEVTLSSDDLRKAFQNELFSEITHVGISGGEPSLFPNLLEHIQIILDSFEQLKSLSITSNCIKPDFWKDNLIQIMQVCNSKDVYFQMNYSLDGIGLLHDKIRGTKGNFSKLEELIVFTTANNIPYQLHCTINRHNIYHINRILFYAKNTGSDIIFRLASPIARLQNDSQFGRIALDDKEKSFLCDFLRSDFLHSNTKSPGRRIFYLKLADQLLGDGRRIAPCYFKQEGIVLESNGKLSYCSRFNDTFSDIFDEKSALKFKDRELFIQCEDDACGHCYHDQTGLWPLSSIIGMRIKPYSTNICKAWYIFTKIPRFLLPSPKPKRNSIKKTSIIGMYGGGHVGDAAILGGVISRMVKRYPLIEKISIYSIRKDRTESWIESLKRLPDQIRIEVLSDDKVFKRELIKSDLLVWAGGPVMEIPVLLTKHLSFIKSAKRHGVKFEMEGVGYGPLSGKYGKWISGKIFSEASRITIRAEKDKSQLGKYAFEKDSLVQDPAFDYLATLEGKELFVDDTKRKAMDRIIGNQNVVGLNLRPLWGRYGNDSGFDFDNFMQEIVHTITLLNTKGFKVVFFPMNADQFGFSDLLASYEIESKLPKNANYEIWETEPSIEELVYFIRKIKAAICMRFHAVVYSLSQGKPTIGIDYSFDGKGKVSTLLNEEYCYNMKNYNASKVTEKLEDLIEKVK